MSMFNLAFYAYASIEFTAGTPGFADQSGDFDEDIVDNGTGDITLSLSEGKGIAAAKCTFAYSVVGALAASQLTSFGTVQDAAGRQKRITILREGAAGAVSALTDVNFEVTIFQKLEI